MSKHNIRTDSYFKEQIMDRGETISSACKTLISEIPNEMVDKLSAMSFDKAKMYVNYVYADFDSTKNSSTNTAFSVRLSDDLENIIDKCSTDWGEKASKSDIIRILLAVGIMYQDYKCYVLKEAKPFSFRMSSSIEKTLSIEMPPSIYIPLSIEVPPSIDILLSIDTPPSIKMQPLIEMQSSIEISLSIEMPPSIKTASSSNTLLSTKISPPYVCYQHGNKENPNIKNEITKILEQIPDDIKTVVEPFMGMCALTINVLATLSDRKLDYYVNDKDKNLVNLYKCINNNNFNKLFRACERLVNRLKTGADTFKTVKDRHLNLNLNHNYNNYDAAADYMYLNVVSERHKKDNLDSDCKSIKKQINRFYKYIVNIRAMHNYLIKTKISHKDALKMLKKLKNRVKTLYLLDPRYLESQGYSSKTNGVDEFTYDNHEELVSLCKNNISSDSIFLLFCRFTSTRSLKKGEIFKDIKIKELNGYFDADDRTLRGFYKRVFGVETKGSKHKFFYKEIPFDNKGTIEVIISNYQFDGFKPF